MAEGYLANQEGENVEILHIEKQKETNPPQTNPPPISDDIPF